MAISFATFCNIIAEGYFVVWVPCNESHASLMMIAFSKLSPLQLSPQRQSI